MICHLEILFEQVRLRVPNVCAVEKRAEEEQGQNGENPVKSQNLLLSLYWLRCFHKPPT